MPQVMLDVLATVARMDSSWLLVGVTCALVAITWKYAKSTEAMARAMQESAMAQVRPIVVINWDAQGEYKASNTGLGSAVSSFRVSDPNDDGMSVTPLGSVLVGEHVALPEAFMVDLRRQLAPNGDRERVYVVAKGAVGETWILSENVIGREYRVHHVIREWKPTKAQLEKLAPLTLDEVLSQAFDRLVEERRAGERAQ